MSVRNRSVARLSAVIALGTACLALSACATPETRLRNGLHQAGLSKPVSACMASRMVDRLSLLQLRRLASLGSLKDKDIRSMPTDKFLHHVRALKDPEILTVTTSSLAICALSS